MDFLLTEQVAYQEAARDFANGVAGPVAEKIDQDQSFPYETWKKAGELGYLGLCIPEEFGGSGTDVITAALVYEEIGKVCCSTAWTMFPHTMGCALPIFKLGTEDQIRKYVPKLASGEWVGCFGETEPNTGSDVAAIQTKAVRDGDYYIVNGSKTFITNGTIADICFLVARTGARSERSRGLTCFIVEKDFPGYQVSKKLDKMGARGSQTAELAFVDMEVPVSNKLGEEGKGFVDAMEALLYLRVAMAATSLGVAEGCYQLAINYSKDRMAFGKNIGSFQAIRHKIADMKVGIEAARWLTYNAAWLIDQNREAAFECSIAKLFASTIAEKVARESLQIHGGYGYIKDYAIERMYRDVRLCTIGEGTDEIHRNIIANHILGRAMKETS